MALYRIPKIVFNSLTLEVGWPLDAAVSWEEPVEGSSFVVAPSGARDSWVPRYEPRLAGTVRWVTTTDTTGFAVPCTGWDEANGWREFFRWARDMNTFEWFPDRSLGTSITSYLVAPLRGEPPLERSGERTFRLVIASADTTTYDGY